MRGIIKHDWHSGLLENRKQILIYVIVFYICGIEIISSVSFAGIGQLSFVENMLVIMQGCAPCSKSMATGANFELPISWMILQIILAYIIGGYPLYDMKTYGINLLVRTKSRTKWWIGKVLWTIELVVACYLLGYLTIGILSAFTGGGFGVIHQDSMMALKGDFTVYNSLGLSFLVFILPVFTSITISIIQLFLMFLFDSVTAYAVVFFFMIASVFYENPIWIFGNGMSVRAKDYLLDGSYMSRIVAMGIVVVVLTIAGAITMKRRDIYSL